MKVRGLAIVVAMLLAVGATAAVYLYVRGVQEDATAPADMVTVIVSKEDISAGTNLDNLVSRGAFTTISIPATAVVEGSVTDLSQLKGQTTRFPILRGEQISAARFQESELQVAGGVLGIPPGFKAVTIPLGVPQAVGGVVQAGDHVTIYATFTDPTLDNPKLDEIAKKIAAGKDVGQRKHPVGSFTVSLVPDVQVLRTSASATTTGDVDADGTVQLTMALSPTDAQRVVFAQASGTVWLALLPPNEEGTEQPPVQVIELIVQ